MGVQVTSGKIGGSSGGSALMGLLKTYTGGLIGGNKDQGTPKTNAAAPLDNNSVGDMSGGQGVDDTSQQGDAMSRRIADPSSNPDTHIMNAWNIVNDPNTDMDHGTRMAAGEALLRAQHFGMNGYGSGPDSSNQGVS